MHRLRQAIKKLPRLAAPQSGMCAQHTRTCTRACQWQPLAQAQQALQVREHCKPATRHFALQVTVHATSGEGGLRSSLQHGRRVLCSMQEHDDVLLTGLEDGSIKVRCSPSLSPSSPHLLPFSFFPSHLPPPCFPPAPVPPIPAAPARAWLWVLPAGDASGRKSV